MQSRAIRSEAPAARPIEVIKAAYDAYGRRDFQAIAALYHPQCELYQSEQLPWGGVYGGHAGLQQFFERLTGAIDTRIVGEVLFEAGDRVVSVGRTRGVARASKTPFELPAVHVYTVDDGTIRRYEAYVDTPGMLQAIGRQG
ncbi:MAG: nuclear transport factor 2 family protein [Phreatobacter sp.]|nr:nuclear transport factor 2 family protein [Phreatobacter sp.]